MNFSYWDENQLLLFRDTKINPSTPCIKAIISPVLRSLNQGKKIMIGTTDGYLEWDREQNKTGKINNQLPWPELTVITEINGHLWFGSAKGAFMLREDGKFNYYYGERWLPGNVIIHISEGPDNSVLILTDKGLGHICSGNDPGR